MLGGKPSPVAEHEARGDTARIYHEIRQTFRVSGVNLNFRTWAAFQTAFPIIWTAMQPIAAARSFETSSDELRARAVRLASSLPELRVEANLGESQRHQIRQALLLYHYVNPKLLLFTVILRRALAGVRAAGGSVRIPPGPQVPFGAPATMAAMEMVDESPADPRLRRLFGDIRRTLRLPAINSDYRTLALWPDYLDPAWAALKPVAQGPDFAHAAETLARAAIAAAEWFPAPPELEMSRLRQAGEKASLLRVTRDFERVLPSLILNIALLARDWWGVDRLGESPFPVTDAFEAERGDRA